ncbi:hypothetical protein [Methyloglobulus morosus]
MFAALAWFERDLISERTKAGLTPSAHEGAKAVSRTKNLPNYGLQWLR